ncbi:hypothetical protein R0595_001498 [Pluralibacter gergoviae]|nr:hypothetical protein [Pluralibacter gergoviae]ELW9441045.1 hypothetical protein [Pluralibacter gergoviae]
MAAFSASGNVRIITQQTIEFVQRFRKIAEMGALMPEEASETAQMMREF